MTIVRKTISLLLAISLYTVPAFSTEGLKQEFSTPTPVPTKMMTNGVEWADRLVQLRQKYKEDTNIPELVELIENGTKLTLEVISGDEEKTKKLLKFKQNFMEHYKDALSPMAVYHYHICLVNFIESKGLNDVEFDPHEYQYHGGMDVGVPQNNGFWHLPVMTKKPHWGFQAINWSLLNRVHMMGVATAPLISHGQINSIFEMIYHDLSHGNRYGGCRDTQNIRFTLNSPIYRVLYDKSLEKFKKNGDVDAFCRTQVALWNMIHESTSQWLKPQDYRDFKSPRELFTKLMQMHVKNCNIPDPYKSEIVAPKEGEEVNDPYQQTVAKMHIFTNMGPHAFEYSDSISFTEFNCSRSTNPMKLNVVCKISGEQELREFLIDSRLGCISKDKSPHYWSLKAAGYKFKTPYKEGEATNVQFLKEGP